MSSNVKTQILFTRVTDYKIAQITNNVQEHVHDLYQWILKLSLICYGKYA